MTTVVAGILMLGILVFVHELGHFLVAKLCGVKVLKFSLGFGPKLVSRRRGETDYQICAIPLGGYVQMLGEGSGEEGESGTLSAAEKQRSFAEKPVSRRLAIVCAGPLMNLLLPLLILPISFLVGVQMPTYLEQPACVGYVVPDSAAAAAGFAPGDCVQTVNGQDVSNWTEANKSFIGEAGDPLIFEADRQGTLVELIIPADNDSLEGLQALGLLPHQEARIGALAPEMPAQQSGLQVGDLILRIGAEPINSWYDLRQVIQQVGAEPVELLVQRDGAQLNLSVTPTQRQDEGDYLIGIAPQQPTQSVRLGPLESLREGAARTWELIELTLVFIQKLFTGGVSTKNIGGPITVVQIAGQAAQTDLAAILSVLAFISIQLGILNLLPIPILDGGHILFYTIELIIRRPLSLRVRETAQQVGMAMLLMLMMLAFYNDILRLWQ